MSRKLEFEEIEHLHVVLQKLTDSEDKHLILSLFCEHAMAVGEIEGMKLGLGLKEKGK